jgi:cell division protein FtsL
VKSLPLALVLAVAVIASAVAVVASKHQSRRLFVELQQLERERDQLEVQWGRLRLEQGAWSTHGRIEQVAREQLDLQLPGPDRVIVVTRPQRAEGQ